MFYLLLAIIVVLIVYAPQLWVKHAIRKHNTHIEEMPGTGSELALHLIERFKLEGVSVKKTSKDEDYYSPGEKEIGLSPEVYDGKSISALAITAHEVGHAIQYVNEEPVSRLRDKYTHRAALAQSIGIYILSFSPVLGGLARSPAVMVIIVLAGLLAMLSSVVLHAMILPEEYDASFSKALPILNEGYLPPEYMPAARQVLKACALTYVSGALADILSVWRWIAILR